MNDHDSSREGTVMRVLGWTSVAAAAAMALVGLVIVVGLPDLEAYGILAILAAVAVLTSGVGLLAASLRP